MEGLVVSRYAARDRLKLFMTHWAGMHVGDVVPLSIQDVRNADRQRSN